MDFVPGLAIALVSVILGSVAMLALAWVQAAGRADRYSAQDERSRAVGTTRAEPVKR